MSRRRILLILWLVSDLVLFVAAYTLAYFLRVGFILSSDFPFTDFLIVAIASAPLWLLILIATRTFSMFRKQATLRTFATIAYASIVATAFFALGYYFFYGLFFSRLLLLEAFVLLVVMGFGWHLCFGALSRSRLRGRVPAFPTLIIGATREAADLIRSLTEHQSPLLPVAVLDGRGSKETTLAGVPILGKLNKLEEILTTYRISHLIQCSDLEQSINLLSACRQHAIAYILLPSVLGIVERDERVELLEGRPVTVVRPAESWWQWFFS